MARTTFSGPVASENGFISIAATSGNTLTIQAPAALSADTTLTFPNGAGSNGQVLTTNGTGTLSFTTVSGTGDVVGPASSTDNALARYDTTTGKLLQNSLVTISDTGAIVAPEAGSVIPFYFANQAAFPSAATYHGAVAHSHADGAMYYAHAGAWTLLYSTSNLALTADTVANLETVGNAINTTGKYTGKMVVILATGLIFTASGAAASDVWRASDGTTTATPV
jgi:hypothetical protein